MKNVSIIGCVFLFASVSAFPQAPGSVPLAREALTAILGQPAGTCAAQPSGVRLLAKNPTIVREQTTCTANCPSGTISCTSSTSCSAVERNCANNEWGHVTCDGATTLCEPCCPGTGIEYACCYCDATDSCVHCCVCLGGGYAQCSRECSGA
jgi:hypothetical protein